MGRTEPKTMLAVGGRSLASRLIGQLSTCVTDAVVVLGGEDSMTEEVLGRSHEGVRLHYARQAVPIGMWDAVRRATPFVRGPFVLAMGDVFFDPSPAPLLDPLPEEDADGAVLVEPIASGPEEPIGLVRRDGAWVTALAKGLPAPGWTDRVAGLAVLPEEALRHPAGDAAQEWEVVATALLDEGARFLGVPYPGWRRNVNTEEDLAAVRARADA